MLVWSRADITPIVFEYPLSVECWSCMHNIKAYMFDFAGYVKTHALRTKRCRYLRLPDCGTLSSACTDTKIASRNPGLRIRKTSYKAAREILMEAVTS